MQPPQEQLDATIAQIHRLFAAALPGGEEPFPWYTRPGEIADLNAVLDIADDSQFVYAAVWQLHGSELSGATQEVATPAATNFPHQYSGGIATEGSRSTSCRSHTRALVGSAAGPAGQLPARLAPRPLNHTTSAPAHRSLAARRGLYPIPGVHTDVRPLPQRRGAAAPRRVRCGDVRRPAR